MRCHIDAAKTLEYYGKKGLSLHRVMDMNAYVCARVTLPSARVRRYFHRKRIAQPVSLLRQLMRGRRAHRDFAGGCDNFAAASVGRSELLLWKDGGRVVRNGDDRSQERVERADKYCRLTAAVRGIRRDARSAYVRKAYRRGRVSDALRRRGESVVEQGVPQDRFEKVGGDHGVRFQKALTLHSEYEDFGRVTVTLE